MRSIVVFFTMVFCLTSQSQAQQSTCKIYGTVTQGREKLPFVTIFVKGSGISTTSNAEGFYHLALPKGNYELVFQYLGSENKTLVLSLEKDTEVNVELKAEAITLDAVDIVAGEDPANPVMRKAIEFREFYLTQVPEYSCKAYIKALQKINELPRNIGSLVKLVGAELSDTNDFKGVVYLSESESDYFYRRPSSVKEIMYSSKVSGDNRSFSFNKLSDMKLNLYSNLVELGNLSSRPFISPLHQNAFLFYRYYLLGKNDKEGKTIFKIKVVPKNNTAACFRGVIYIQDQTWRLTGSDLFLTRETRINFVDTLHIRQLYAPVLRDSVWLPFSLNLAFSFRFLGFKGGGYYNAMISDYHLSPGLGRDFFDNEVLVVKDSANQKDSAYWSRNRQIPLTSEEIQDYREKDSLRIIREKPRYMDSVDRVNNRLKLPDLLLGYHFAHTRKKFVMDVPGLIMNGIHFNTVEGPNASLKFNAEKSFDNFTQYQLNGRIRYGFYNKLWGAQAEWKYLYDAKKRGVVRVDVKSIVEQYNRDGPISPLVNSFYTLVLNRNYMKLFKESGGLIELDRELLNGLYVSTSAGFFEREELKNRSDLVWRDDPGQRFTVNDPSPASDPSPRRSRYSSSLVFDLNIRIRFRQKYISQPRQKIVTGSKYPRLSLIYKKAVPVSPLGADYDLAELKIGDRLKLGIVGQFNYLLAAGVFLNNSNLYFMDFRHFMGNQTLINTSGSLSSYRLLPYYTYSADQWFCESHFEHHFQGILLGQLPLLKKMKAQEVLGLHVLTNNRLQSYYEINMGLERLFKVLRAEYVLGYFPDGHLVQGLNFSLQLGF